jgi:tetratricopeptide (TPR) repeat protein
VPGDFVARRHEHFAQPLTPLVHVVLCDRDPAAVPVFSATVRAARNPTRKEIQCARPRPTEASDPAEGIAGLKERLRNRFELQSVLSCQRQVARVHELTFWTLMREYSRVEVLAMQTVEFADEHQFVEAAARSRCMLGEARAQLGDARNGIALIREYMPRLLPVGRVVISKYVIGLAAAQACAGAIADGLETIDQVLTIKPEEPAYRPEALRVRGELHLKERRTELAEEDFREALDLAQKMRAKAWELRSTISLARLLRDTGRHDVARTMLAEIHNWFNEGLDTPDRAASIHTPAGWHRKTVAQRCAVSSPCFHARRASASQQSAKRRRH